MDLVLNIYVHNEGCMRNVVSGTGLTKDGANVNWIFPLMQQNNQDERSPEFLQGCLCHCCLETWKCFIQSQVTTPACKDDYSTVTGSSFTFSWFLLSWNMWTWTCWGRSKFLEIFLYVVKQAKKIIVRYLEQIFSKIFYENGKHGTQALPSRDQLLPWWPDIFILWQFSTNAFDNTFDQFLKCHLNRN